MTRLDPIDRELLDFLCACAHHRVRIVQIKAPRLASLRRLRQGGHVGLDDHLPSAPALLGWIERQRTKSEAANASAAAEEPPQARAAEQGGGGAVRCNAPPPKPAEAASAITDSLRFFRREWEPLGIVADRWGRGSGIQFRGTAVKLRDLGLIEMQFIRGVDAQALWRLAEIPSTEGPHPSAEPPAVAPTADESAVAVPVTPRPAFEEPSERVDLKVNAEPKIKRRAPCAPANETQSFQRQAQRAMRTNRRNAEAFLDSGKTSNDATSVSLRIEARKVEIVRAEEARLLDPVEQAKTVIRIAGWNCFAAVISGGPLGKFYIGNKLVDEAGLLAFAEDLRTRRRRRAG